MEQITQQDQLIIMIIMVIEIISTIINSNIVILVVLKILNPKYIIDIWTIIINNIINKNILFSFKWAKIFILSVLALNELNTAIKINKVK